MSQVLQSLAGQAPARQASVGPGARKRVGINSTRMLGADPEQENVKGVWSRSGARSEPRTPHPHAMVYEPRRNGGGLGLLGHLLGCRPGRPRC